MPSFTGTLRAVGLGFQSRSGLSGLNARIPNLGPLTPNPFPYGQGKVGVGAPVSAPIVTQMTAMPNSPRIMPRNQGRAFM